MSFAVLSPAFRGLQFPFRDMFVLTVDRNSFTRNNGRPSFGLRVFICLNIDLAMFACSCLLVNQHRSDFWTNG